MRDKCKVWHLDCLTSFKAGLYENLLYEHNLSTETLKIVEMKEQDGGEKLQPMRGFFAVKDKVKYFLNEEIIPELPIRVKGEFEEFVYNEDIIRVPLNYSPFKIIPEHTISARKLIDGFAPFNHTNPECWTLTKMVALMGYVGKTFVCISSKSSFGKSAVFDMVDGITDKCPVFKPRSVPGVLNQINGYGNTVFDEAQECNKQTKEVMEEFSLQIGGNKSVYINGALKARNTKAKYPCPLQSITFLFNNVENYRNPSKDYFEFIFSNNKAIDDRFLKIKLAGNLTEVFDRKFDIPKTAEDNKDYYIGLAKELSYLQQLKQSNGYVRRFERVNPLIVLTGRKKQVYDEITWLIDLYSNDNKEYNEFCNVLEQSILDYKDMVDGLIDGTQMIQDEEVVE